MMPLVIAASVRDVVGLSDVFRGRPPLGGRRTRSIGSSSAPSQGTGEVVPVDVLAWIEGGVEAGDFPSTITAEAMVTSLVDGVVVVAAVGVVVAAGDGAAAVVDAEDTAGSSEAATAVVGEAGPATLPPASAALAPGELARLLVVVLTSVIVEAAVCVSSASTPLPAPAVVGLATRAAPEPFAVAVMEAAPPAAAADGDTGSFFVGD